MAGKKLCLHGKSQRKSQTVSFLDRAEPRPRRGHGEDSMYFDRANNYWVAAVSLGYKAGKPVRRKVTGRTKTEVKATLRDRAATWTAASGPARPTRSAPP